jgi:tetratricopeptide (TPR) repeat protein
MKKLIILFILFSNFIYSQDEYFNGKKLHCQTENKEAKRLFDSGIKILHLNENLTPKYLAINADIFAKSILQDTTFCDSYFFAGYLLNLQHKYRDSYAFLKMADTLVNKPILIYKQNLAAICLKIDHYVEARKCYQEIVKYFPENTEGYYGIALTSTMIGDISYGLENINIAEKKHNNENIDTQFLKAILLTLNNMHKESLEYFEKVQSKFSKDDYFNGNYALSLYEVATISNDEKMLKKAKKYYEKVKDKSKLTDFIKSKFENK